MRYLPIEVEMRSGRSQAQAARRGHPGGRSVANRCRLIPCPQVKARARGRNVNKETHMSSIANLGAASAALPQLNFHPHGHKKGWLSYPPISRAARTRRSSGARRAEFIRQSVAVA